MFWLNVSCNYYFFKAQHFECEVPQVLEGKTSYDMC